MVKNAKNVIFSTIIPIQETLFLSGYVIWVSALNDRNFQISEDGEELISTTHVQELSIDV